MFGLSKPLVYLSIGLVLVTVAGLGAWRAAAELHSIVGETAQVARAERDAHWRAEIEKANAVLAAARAEQAQAAAVADAAIRDIQERFEADVRDLAAKNAALAGAGSCGIEHARVRLLNGSR